MGTRISWTAAGAGLAVLALALPAAAQQQSPTALCVETQSVVGSRAVRTDVIEVGRNIAGKDLIESMVDGDVEP